VSIASRPLAARAAARSPLHGPPLGGPYESEGCRDSAGEDDEQPQWPSRRGPHPLAARSAEGAIACGMFEMKRRRKGSPLIARLCQVALSQAVDGYFVDCDGDFDYLDCLCNPTTPIYKRGQVVPAT
jgi:hypothetical protein